MVRLTDCPDMTIAVYRGHRKQQYNNNTPLLYDLVIIKNMNNDEDG